ncbi:TIGR03862 family flavoprotein [Pikeienuella sp. HZG-20]|uniref:TIGR03862 family flavoprotein n=1 Tax=Paludibacillus litoralis TaxID=3133267 RepID=UPI0030EE9DC8
MIGAGPAGLAAAEALAESGAPPLILEAKPSPARKFLMAGKSGLNLTMAEPAARFAQAIGVERLGAALEAFGPDAAIDWAEDLGEPLFVGSSRRVFPKAMKGSPLLRKWLARLSDRGAELRTRWRWTGWEDGGATFETPSGPRRIDARATVLALGGASWPQLGSDAAWVPLLEAAGASVAPLRPANMGFDCAWSAHFRARFAGAPVKAAALSHGGRRVRGEFTITASGVEGGAIYALSAPLRDALATGPAALSLDLAPDRTVETLARRLGRPRGRNSRANHLRKTIGLVGVRAGLLRELAPEAPDAPLALAALIKALPLPLLRARPLAEAISSAGGVEFEALDEGLMLLARPGVFVAGEMLDWEAPTGGYLLTASMATGRLAGRAAARWAGRSAHSLA